MYTYIYIYIYTYISIYLYSPMIISYTYIYNAQLLYGQQQLEKDGKSTGKLGRVTGGGGGGGGGGRNPSPRPPLPPSFTPSSSFTASQQPPRRPSYISNTRPKAMFSSGVCLYVYVFVCVYIDCSWSVYVCDNVLPTSQIHNKIRFLLVVLKYKYIICI